MAKSTSSMSHVSSKATTSAANRADTTELQTDASLRHPVLDESLIREQTKVAHFWGESSEGRSRSSELLGVGGLCVLIFRALTNPLPCGCRPRICLQQEF